MKTFITIIYYANILVVILALFYTTSDNTEKILALLIPGFAQPFLALLLLAQYNFANKKTFQLLQKYWLGVAISLVTLMVYGAGVIVGIFLIFYFTYVTYKFQKDTTYYEN